MNAIILKITMKLENFKMLFEFDYFTNAQFSHIFINKYINFENKKLENIFIYYMEP